MKPVSQTPRVYEYRFVKPDFTDDRLWIEITDPARIERIAGFLENTAEMYEAAMAAPELPISLEGDRPIDYVVGLHERMHGTDPCDCAKQAIRARLNTRSPARTKLIKIKL